LVNTDVEVVVFNNQLRFICETVGFKYIYGNLSLIQTLHTYIIYYNVMNTVTYMTYYNVMNTITYIIYIIML